MRSVVEHILPYKVWVCNVEVKMHSYLAKVFISIRSSLS